jgi:AcrR family transcriptional regulator
MPSATGTDETTRERVLAAAVEIILEEGYYRASSNHIAKRAGVTWGVIQYHFGSRERLLLEVVRAGSQSLVQTLRAAEIDGDTIQERVDSLADVIWGHYRRPEFLALLQVLLNLSKEPRTSADTVEAMAAIEGVVGDLWRDLVDQAIPAEHQRPDLGGVIFHLIRGLAIGSNLMDAIPHTKGPRTDEDPREVLIQALSLYVATV